MHPAAKTTPKPTTNKLVSGAHGGKRIYITPSFVQPYNALKSAADRGQHWARLAVHGIRSLATGRLNKDNIFVHPGSKNENIFYVVLPGCKATVERRDNDDYYIFNLQIDSTYFDTNNQNTMTGLYSAVKSEGKWNVSYHENGELIPDGAQGDNAPVRQRIVAISDGDHEDATRAAENMANLVSKAPGSTRGAYFTNYDIHYTSIGKKLGGIRNYKQAKSPLTNQEIHGSAIMLAHTMYKARDIRGINWVSEFGGSAVLTQAMKILADQGVKLDKHGAFLYRPSTDPDQALQLAHRLSLNLDRDFIKTTWSDYMGNRTQGRMAWKRLRGETDYKLGNYIWDMVGQVKNVQTLAGGVTAGLGVLGVATASPAAIPMLAAIGGAIGVGVGALKIGDSLAEQVAPRAYHKHIGKIK